VDSLKSSFRESVTIAETGGKGGGGVTLTPFGRQLIKSYRALERDIALIASRRLRPVAPAVIARTESRSGPPPKVPARKRRNRMAG
jgi:molybdenum-dependent DNA-binding transcriptional regulator ModE